MLPAGDPAPRLTRRIGRYAVVGRIGRGGMGMVYRGRDEALERDVAVKTLTVEGTLDEESRRRFEIEAKAAARLQHPNIVTVFELGEDHGLPFIAMELLPGTDLESLVRGHEPLLLEEKLDVVVQVLRGLQFAHDHGIVHRDVKPSNIRLLDDGSAKIMDFGIAKLGGTGVTKTGMMVGTVHYMSPEQVRGRPLDGRSDVFSAGVILYELLAGRRPFTGDTPTAVLYKIVHDPAPVLEPAAAEAAPGLGAALERALAKDREQRPTAGRLADDLAAILASLRAGRAAPPPEVLDGIVSARRAAREGRAAEGVRLLASLAEGHPPSVDLQRALRAARRAVQRPAAEPPGPDDFAELDATYQAAPTRKSPETVVAAAPADDAAPATLVAGAPEAARARATGGRGLLVVAGLAALLVASVGIALLARRAPPAAPLRPALTVPQAAARAGAPAASAPAVPPTPVPAAARVPSPAPVATGRVAFHAPYPVDVVWRGQTLARGEAAGQVSVPVGRQVVTLVSAANFLRMNATVEVTAEGTAALEAPPLGRLNVRANPDNCQVFVDGAFVDYPPILDRAIAAGTHRVAFKWPDGTRQEETVEVARGAPAYVTGRKD